MKLSVIIPVRNGEATLGRCLSSIRAQSIGPGLEIIVLDTASSDKSRGIAEGYGAKIIAVEKDQFDHGLTRNLGVQHASGDLLYFTVQDAWIPDTKMLETMTEHFKQDGAIIAVCGHQAVPHEKDKNPMLWFRPVSKPGITIKSLKDRGKFGLLSKQEQQHLISWDNVVAMYRKSALKALPFTKTSFAEDWLWNYEALRRGWSTMHDSSLVVFHYHHQTFGFSFRSTYCVNYHFSKYFGYLPELPSVITPATKAAYHILKNKQLSLDEKIYWCWHNALAIVAKFLSVLDLRIRMRTGGKVKVEGGYNLYCRRIPQGKQRKGKQHIVKA